MSDQPRIPYWHLWTDDDGVSHQDALRTDRMGAERCG